ncbi:MAG: hypothetical protein ABEJ57_05250 [Halobacteriaceae archaeon]
MLVHPFVPAVTAGELSMVFFGGEFNHAYRTVPAAGEVRAHPDFGGSIEPTDPSGPLRDQARTVVATAGTVLGMDATTFVYARVDGGEPEGAFELMELEMIDPSLGLSTSEGPVDRFAEAIDRRLNPSRVEGR